MSEPHKEEEEIAENDNTENPELIEVCRAFLFDEDDIADPQLGSTTSGRKRLFSKELRCMMYGYGDDQNPYTESVDLLEDLVIEFITETTHRAMEIGRTGRVQVEDIVFLVRKDQRKYARVKDLLTMNEELKRARKAFDEIKYVGSKCKSDTLEKSTSFQPM
ncbi:transcription initiation factor TFIID subunit 13 isoform X2 [Sitodiplosis mosellana]|uniref:transcription initiation factor TFIID subunit 13 isoform X2 n=1 Tax=Sitodiplosis mosellana TaxID=263140 RepID=UPI0024446286|nr:transcription initiation factor TFIID subunit 13 isoform X2 [Sitodiplosis mosellana]